MAISRTAASLSLAMAVFLTAGMKPCVGGPIVLRQSTAAGYSCPMHPEVKSASSITCPKCGMRLTAVADSEQPESARLGAKDGSTLDLRIPDVLVYDQGGRKLNFHSDLIKGKTVAINFIFTTCTTICPPLTATMRQVQRTLGQRVGRDVWLISVSVDPVTDTSERLRGFASRFGAGPGWTFVTGSRTEINQLLKALGAYVSDKNDHSPIILVGNEPTGHWTRSYGLAPASTIARLITETAARRTRD